MTGTIPWGGVTLGQIEELADRLTGFGMNGLRPDDWPTLVNILEAASFIRARDDDAGKLADASPKAHPRPEEDQRNG